MKYMSSEYEASGFAQRTQNQCVSSTQSRDSKSHFIDLCLVPMISSCYILINISTALLCKKKVIQ
jgi:hypothetical protein